MFERLKNFLNSSPLVQNNENASSKSKTVKSDLRLPETASINIYRGDRLWEESKFTEAIEYYRQAVEIEPNLGIAHQKLALALQKIGKIPEAMVHYRKAIMLNNSPTQTHPPRNLAKTLQLPNFESKSSHYRQLEIVTSSEKSTFSFK